MARKQAIFTKFKLSTTTTTHKKINKKIRALDMGCSLGMLPLRTVVTDSECDGQFGPDEGTDGHRMINYMHCPA